jgi:regulator of cell morphogenesis and NO signaling
MTLSKASLPLADRLLADVVSHDGRAAMVLDRFGLDYCCHGDETIAEAAARLGVPTADVVAALERLGPQAPSDAPESADLDVLVRHIVTRHHAYLREQTPAITAWLDKLVARHGGRHPELRIVRDIFLGLAADLRAHMAKEENVLFPFIVELATAAREGRRLPQSPFGTILHPVRVMNRDHLAACELTAQLRQQTHHYQPPAEGCRTYQLCFAELARFDADLSRHIHLEDHVLFPRALELETAFT